ncbi:MAG TPA: hypothetical protein ENH82_01030 [bacterium]|nr:hypothetical protein [bacterium]
MKSVVDSLKEMSEEIKSDIETLLLNYTTIHSDRVFSSSGDHYWGSLSREGNGIQSKVLETYQQFSHLVNMLIIKQSQDVAGIYYAHDMKIKQIIEQKGNTWYKTPPDVLTAATETMDKYVGLLEELYDPSDGRAIYVPDTNALVYNPELEKWRFPDAQLFKIFLIPLILFELDTIRDKHENEMLREKAESLIGKIKGFRSRGRLTDGVPLVEGISEIVAGALEPDFENTLPWLNVENSDDRILASFIEIIRLHPHSPVVLVTCDINLQNKAEFARLQFEEPPAL